jgi:small redox-active disulfide protein 2
MKIAVLGSGCATCKKLHESVVKVVKGEKIDAEVEYSDDVTKIVELGLMHSPVLVIDGKPVELKSNSEKDVKEAILNKIEKQGDCNRCSCGGKC